MKVNCRTATQSDVRTAVKSNSGSYSYGVRKTCLSSLIRTRIYAERQSEYITAIPRPAATASQSLRSVNAYTAATGVTCRDTNSTSQR